MSELNPFDLDALASAERKTEEEEKFDRQVEIDDFKFVMEDKRGRRFIWRQLAGSGVFRSSFSGDNNTTNFREGARNVGLKLMALIHEACPEKYHLMLKEQKEYARRQRTGRK